VITKRAIIPFYVHCTMLKRPARKAYLFICLFTHIVHRNLHLNCLKRRKNL